MIEGMLHLPSGCWSTTIYHPGLSPGLGACATNQLSSIRSTSSVWQALRRATTCGDTTEYSDRLLGTDAEPRA